MANNAPTKSFSFDMRLHDDNTKNENKKDISKSHSFASRTHSDFNSPKAQDADHPPTINEFDDVETEEPQADQELSLDQLSDEINQFITSVSANDENEHLEIPNTVAQFLKMLESRIENYESSEEECVPFGRNAEEDTSFLVAVTRVSALMEAINEFKSRATACNYAMPLLNQASSVLHRAMVLVEDELRYLLEESACQSNSSPSRDSNPPKHADSSKGHLNLKGRIQSFHQDHHQQQEDFCVLPDRKSEVKEGEDDETTTITFPCFSPEILSIIKLISNAMITSGYDAECHNVFIITRRHAFEEELKRQGFDKISVDDVQKMSWEPLEGEIATWIRAFKHCSTNLFPGEHRFYNDVLADHPATRRLLFANLSSSVYSLLVNFAEAVSLSKRSTEKLFKFLDMYETLRDLNISISTSVDSNCNDNGNGNNNVNVNEKDNGNGNGNGNGNEKGNEKDNDSGNDNKNVVYYPEECGEELKQELSFAGSRLGEAAVSIFCQLENSIKSDNAKTPVPSGAVHPLTRYTMNYLKYACEYRDTLEQVFKQHLKTDQSEDYDTNEGGGGGEKEDNNYNNNDYNKHDQMQSPFASQLMRIMDLLDSNLEAKSKLYKDLSLRYIFLMNNVRYMLQKAKGSTEIHQVVGDTWCRKRSSHVRNYHKSYQRETWSRVLQCLNQEGLQVNGKIHKPVLKERFKNFNQLFDDIHRTQSGWVVSDEQLQSELRVSISAVMIPAYRSFVSRFGQIFTPGRQAEKYIKYQPEDIETVIEDLFDGTQSLSMARRRT